MSVILATTHASFATTKGLNQIVTPDLQGEGNFSLSFRAQSQRIGNPYEIQSELGLTKSAEVTVTRVVGLTRHKISDRARERASLQV